MTVQTLLLMRHAHYRPANNPDLTDLGFPLSDQGRQQAAQLGSALVQSGDFPNLIWCSPSQRTRDTASVLMQSATIEIPIIEHEMSLYQANADQILYFCDQKGEPDADTLMILSHNPALEQLFAYFCRSMANNPRALTPAVPMGGCIVLKRSNVQTGWLEPSAWRLANFILPSP